MMSLMKSRAEISFNRRMVYPCLYDLIRWTRYHVAYGVFFHYFAHLYHIQCEPFRGKRELLEDITVMEKTFDV